MADSNPEGTVAAEERTARLLGIMESEETNHAEEVEEEQYEDEFVADDELEAEGEASAESADEDEDGQDDDTNDEPQTEDGMRLADYTRKTQELAREREAFQAEVQRVQHERQFYAQHLGQLAQATMPQRPDFDALANEHGAEAAMRARFQYENAMEQYQRVESQRQATAQKIQATQAQQHRQWLQQEQEALIAARPEWKDPAVFQKASTDIEEFAIGLGYTPNQLSEVSHKDIIVLDAARKWFAAEAKAKKVKPTQGKVLRPGARGQVAGKSRARKVTERFRETGTVEDGADALRLIKERMSG